MTCRSILVTHPGAAQMYSSENKVPVSQVKAGSDIIAEWVCGEGHRWPRRVSDQIRSSDCPVCAGTILQSGYTDLATRYPELLQEWHPDENSVSPSDILPASTYMATWRCKRGHTWRTRVYVRTRNLNAGCPECAARSYVSKFEQEIAAYIRSLVGAPDAVGTSVRRFRASGVTELDIYVDSAKVAVEANGVYWHSEAAGKRQHAHAEKHVAARQLGIQLIQVWEDDWADRRQIVERMLAHKLGVSTEPRIAARSTVARAATTAEARKFLEANHIQGFTGATHHLALEHEGKMVALMSLKRTGKPGELRLERYATSAHVLGGQSKLIRFAERELPEWTYLLTFADHEVSDGSLYERTGWVKDAEIPADYKYVVNGRRVHKFNYRLKRFRDDPTLMFEEGMSERELAALNKLPRVWDSGKDRYRYTRKR